jgi:hypothetical protein
MVIRHTVAAHRRGNWDQLREFDPASHFGFDGAQWKGLESVPKMRPNVKLSSIPVAAAAALATTVALTMLAACATTSPQPVAERLDPDTATTVTVIKKPIELVGAVAHAPTGNPFAFIAPFETDRMGKRALYLWMSAPSSGDPNHPPQLICDGHVLALPPLDGDISHLGLSSAPYPAPVPWDKQWYFQLSQDGLDCMAAAQRVSLETYGVEGAAEQYSVESKDLALLKEFSSH